MQRTFFMETGRIGFSKWTEEDLPLAEILWGDPQVTKYISSSERFSKEDIKNRLKTEIENGKKYHVQYWQIFELDTGEFIGCCGLRPHEDDCYELGFHLRPQFWGKGYAEEAAHAVIDYAFRYLYAGGLFAGHNPNNAASKKLLLKLGFTYIGDEFYGPTGLFHPPRMN